MDVQIKERKSPFQKLRGERVQIKRLAMMVQSVKFFAGIVNIMTFIKLFCNISDLQH